MLYFKVFGQTFISNDKYFAVMASVSSVFNAGGRFFWGFMIDRYPYKVNIKNYASAGGWSKFIF